MGASWSVMMMIIAGVQVQRRAITRTYWVLEERAKVGEQRHWLVDCQVLEHIRLAVGVVPSVSCFVR